MSLISILRELMHQLREAPLPDPTELSHFEKYVVAGHAVISAQQYYGIAHNGEPTKWYGILPEKRFWLHQHWQAACQSVISRKTGIEEVFGIFPKGKCVQTSLFAGDPMFWRGDALEVGEFTIHENVQNCVIGYGFPQFRIYVTSNLPGVHSYQWGLYEDALPIGERGCTLGPDHLSVDWDQETGLLRRKSGSGRTNYLMYITPRTHRCIPISEELWENKAAIQMICAANNDSESENEEEAELIYVEGSDEVRRQVNGIWQHKHGDYDYWHPMARIHKETRESMEAF